MNPIPKRIPLGVALAVLALAGPAAAQPEPNAELIKQLKSTDGETRGKALKAFKELGPKAAKLVPDLKAMVNPANPPTDTKEAAQPVWSASLALYYVGTNEARKVLEEAMKSVTDRVAEAYENDRDPKHYDAVLNDKIGTLLNARWPFHKPALNIPVKEQNAEQLRDHIAELKNRIAECKARRGAAIAANKDLPAGTQRSFNDGLILGFAEVIPKLEGELRQAEELLKERAKEKK